MLCYCMYCYVGVVCFNERIVICNTPVRRQSFFYFYCNGGVCFCERIIRSNSRILLFGVITFIYHHVGNICFNERIIIGSHAFCSLWCLVFLLFCEDIVT